MIATVMFADYTSYLELSFSLNLMFFLWDDFLKYMTRILTNNNDELIKEIMKQRKYNKIVVDNLVNKMKNRVNKCDTKCLKHKRSWKIVSIIFAMAILISLVAVPDSRCIDSLIWQSLIAIAPAPTLTICVIIFGKKWRCLCKNKRSFNEVSDVLGDPTETVTQTEKVFGEPAMRARLRRILTEQLRPWHSVNSSLYHVCASCPLGSDITLENRREGIGDRQLCHECAQRMGTDNC